MTAETSPQDRRRGRAGVTRAQIAEIARVVDDVRAAEIIATGASVEELEEAVAWASGESDVMGRSRLRGSAVVRAVYDLLTAEEKYGDERC